MVKRSVTFPAETCALSSSATVPALPLLAREAISFAYMRASAAFASAVPLNVEGNNRAVVVIPGFLASDHTTSRLRRSLLAAGFQAFGWGLGRNKGIRADIFDRLERRMDDLAIDMPVTLVGWSLGGLVAREYAKYAPHRIAKVITLGSPFSGHPRANNAWRMYEIVAGHTVDAPPIKVTLAQKPPVHTCAFWSARDGVVAPCSARGHQDESDERTELDCSHMAFVTKPDAIRMIAKAIAA
jgi:pimeloyl-ACP methyl ester carboxylesterase